MFEEKNAAQFFTGCVVQLQNCLLHILTCEVQAKLLRNDNCPKLLTFFWLMIKHYFFGKNQENAKMTKIDLLRSIDF